MTIDPVAVLRDAWALFRRDRDLLLRIAGVFHFLPAFALALLVPEPPMPESGAEAGPARTDAWMQALSDWGAAHGGWYLLAYAIGFLGTAAILLLYLAPQQTVGQALTRAARLWPRFLLAMVLVSLPTGAGMLLWIVPGLYVAGRLLVTGPALVAEGRMSAAGALRRSFRMSRGAGLALMGLASVTYLGGFLAGQPFLWLGDWLSGEGGGNPIGVAVVEACAAAVVAATAVAQALIAVVAYRRLASRGI
ncbi:hypothetical protein [Sphingomonas sp. GM_Shp_2]|uniref:hypothetical protein n=1 Tax=Sphingomonas sp. GM_Shp_2 TaxID=2937380 RepID=UPI002269E6E4|nr:hypothetical protein [Sphingomonas sp. GM_Shp_2]